MTHVPRGVETLVSMRADLLTTLRDSENGGSRELRAMDADLKAHLAVLFSTGLLELQRLTRQPPGG